MYIDRNKRGNEVFYQSESKINCWGFMDDDGNYKSDRNMRQIFRLYKNALAIQDELLTYLETKYHDGLIKLYITEYEPQPFFAIIRIKDFRELAWSAFGSKAVFNYGQKWGQQIRVPMDGFTRIYKLNAKIVEIQTRL
jgi:hypothetical protein